MNHVVPVGLIFLYTGAALLHAGGVLTLTNGLQVAGKATLTSATVHVESNPTPTDINLSDVLEADFSDAPFQLNFFTGTSTNPVPPTWKGQDIGSPAAPGSSTVGSDGTVTISAGGGGGGEKPSRDRQNDDIYFQGGLWTSNGVWTARLQLPDTRQLEFAGLMVRGDLTANAPMAGVSASGNATGGFHFRDTDKSAAQVKPFPLDLPTWLRLTRYGTEILAAISSDDVKWETIGQTDLKALANPCIGIWASAHASKNASSAQFDQFSLTPLPSSAQILPPGVLLQSGSFIAGNLDHLDFTNPDGSGSFRRNGRSMTIPRSKIAVVLTLPTSRSQIAGMASHVGLLMKNSDTMDGDFTMINQLGVQISSVLLGTTTYERSDVTACLLQPVQEQAAPYEVRLKDGSILNASGVSVTNEEVVITEISGVTVDATMDEIAQFRAGTAQVQTLAKLDWKATAPAPPAPPASTATGTNAPAAAQAPNPGPAVQCWEGPNQEQVLEAATETTIEFPLNGKFRAMGVKIALAPDSPPSATATIRVLADGREVATTPPFKAGEQPRFMELSLQNAHTVTLVANSMFAGTKVFFIDPVAIRSQQ